MDFYTILDLLFYIILTVLLLAVSGLIIVLALYLSGRNKLNKNINEPFPVASVDRPLQGHHIYFDSDDGEKDKLDIKTFSTKDILKSNQFSSIERKMEYRRRGKSPSGVIDGVYNDMYRENGHSYSDVDRDWDADA